MLSRYTRIRKFLRDLESEEIDSFSLTLFEKRRIGRLLGEFDQLDSVTKALRNGKATVSDIRALFGSVIDSMDCLTSIAAIIHCPVFESAIVRFQGRQGDTLSRIELSGISVLSLSEVVRTVGSD